VRFWPDIAFGTRGYPEKIARRLRAVNITAWIGAPVAAAFALFQAAEDWERLKLLAAINALDALIWAAVPLLHRFGPLAATLTLAGSAYASNFALTYLLGTGAGIHLYYISTAALAVLFLGVERVVLAVSVVMIAAVLFVFAEFALPADTQLVPKLTLHANFIVSATVTLAILFAVVFYAVGQIGRAEAALEREFARSEALLTNILPPAVAARLKQGAESVIADSYAEASILFADMAGFTARASSMRPVILVLYLNRVFSAFDRLVERYGLEKIKTTGDSYMVVSGVPVPRPNHAEAIARLALDMHEASRSIADGAGQSLAIRIGISSGPVVAGVVGTKKFFYDVWGDTVNVASRMESTGEAGRIHVSDATYQLIKDGFECAERGEIEVRGKGKMRTWYLVAARASPISPARMAP
jgi:adenylate cyclase